MLAESLKRAFIIRKDDFVSRSDAGQLVPERLWKIGRTDDDKLFNRNISFDDPVIISIIGFMKIQGKQMKESFNFGHMPITETGLH